MLVFHQSGHNLIWNLDSLVNDHSGYGLILSPVNDGPEKLLALPEEIRENSFLDPQFYLPESERGKFQDYHFFPSTALGGRFSTVDFETVCWEVAQKCVNWQKNAGFNKVVIPTRYFDAYPSDYFSYLSRCFIEPFVAAAEMNNSESPLILALIVKGSQLVDEDQRNHMLNWVTGLSSIDGVYLIFEQNGASKQIKDPMFLGNALQFIHALKYNDLSVHIGYNNTEGLLYSVAGADSISMGAYENLRRFGASRFELNKQKGGQQPNPRLYSGALLQWIEFTYVQAIQLLYPGWKSLFEETKYTPLNFKPGNNWNLRQPDLYKHFFKVYSDQVAALPKNLGDREKFVRELVKRATGFFKGMEEKGVALDQNSDGSHLPAWLTALNLFREGK